MRLLALAPTGFFADYGCHIRIMGQLQALQRRGYQVRLLTYPAGRDLPGLPTMRPPLPFARAMPVGSSRRKLLLDALLAPTALAAALRFRPQIIHAYLHEGALIGWGLARLFGAPLTFDYQGSLTAEMLDHHFLSLHSPLLPAWQRLERWIDARPQAIFPSSRHAAAALAPRTPPRLHPLPDAIDPDLFAPRPPDPALRARLGLDPSRPTVVYLGLLAWYQGINLLLQAIACPPLAAHPAQFLIMGFPNESNYRRLAARLAIEHRVHFTGPIPYLDAPHHLALGDVAVAPKLSATEGSGKLLPYMSLALPIVATDTPVHREYLGEDGILVEHRPEALAEGLVWALDHLPALRAPALRRRHQVQTHYTWDQGAAMMDEVFREVSGQGDR
ncbi:MAG: glycosyltransferase family 4 protein, partial [Caldilineales bacterium]|nr:glycosyltransferase family 4 protein [Caldilineales bacterium]